MPAPLYNTHSAPQKKPDHAHAGLWFERFFNGYDNDWTIADTAKQTWIKSVTGKQGDNTKLDDFTKRQHALVLALQGESRCYTTDWHFITGMGNPHPVENGFSWHPTLAVPYVAGSAVKGLIRAWVEINEDGLTDEEKKARLKQWFGTEDKEQVAEQTGAFIFFDAIPHTPPTTLCDIMTPHMGKWYEQGDDVQKNLTPEVIPADWHEPVPVPFLAVKKAQFIFSIATRKPNNDAHRAELPAIFEALNNALLWLGAGAKTAAGYGYMDNNLEDNKRFDQKINDWVEKERADAEATERKQQQDEQLKNRSPAAQEYFKDEDTQKWESDKDKFLQNGIIENWLTKLEAAPEPDADILADIVRLLNKHIAGLLDNPNKVKGKKEKPFYNDRQKKIANRVKALQS